MIASRKKMAKIWTPQSIEVYRSWVDIILSEASDELSVWETNFINDMDEKLTLYAGFGKNLSQGQAEKLEDIYAKYTK